MQTVTVSDLQTHLAAYLEQVSRGEELLVEDQHRPIARLLPLAGEAGLDEEEPRNIRSLPPGEGLRIDHSDTWSEQDRSDLTAFSLQYAATLYPEEVEIV